MFQHVLFTRPYVSTIYKTLLSKHAFCDLVLLTRVMDDADISFISPNCTYFNGFLARQFPKCKCVTKEHQRTFLYK